jgi:flagellar biogenesis protein FliO
MATGTAFLLVMVALLVVIVLVTLYIWIIYAFVRFLTSLCHYFDAKTDQLYRNNS